MFYRTRYVQEHYTRSTGAIGEINGVPKPDHGTQGKEGNHTSNTRSWHREYLVRKKEENTGVVFVAVCVLCESFRLCNAYALYQACAGRGVPFRK